MQTGLTTRIDVALKEEFTKMCATDPSKVMRILIEKFVNGDIELTQNDINSELKKDKRFSNGRI